MALEKQAIKPYNRGSEEIISSLFFSRFNVSFVPIDCFGWSLDHTVSTLHLQAFKLFCRIHVSVALRDWKSVIDIV